VSLSAFIKQEGAPAEQIVTTSSTVTQGAATADNSILEGLVQECKGRRVDPSDGRLYDFASFRSCYGSDALRLWRLAGALAEQRAKACQWGRFVPAATSSCGGQRPVHHHCPHSHTLMHPTNMFAALAGSASDEEESAEEEEAGNKEHSESLMPPRVFKC
jgi:hypothetical protein